MNDKDKLDFLGITKFHEAGILGQGISVASIENGLTEHSKKVLDILRTILPEATIYTSVKYWRDNIPELDGYTSSLEYAYSDKPERVVKQKELYDKNVFMTVAIGNEDIQKYNKVANYDEWVSVGACKLKDNSVIPEYYSSESCKLDFCSLTNWHTEHGFFNGTSCSTPVLQGMAMLIQCYYKLNHNTKLSNKQLYNYIRRHSIDISANGFDNKTGYGLFILPNPEDVEDGNVEIVMKIGNKKAQVNGKEIELDVAPKIENGRTLVPIRFISECLNCDVSWDNLEHKIIITN